MLLDLGKMTKAISKISDITSGDKTIPGILFNLVKTDESNEGTLHVCYSDGHKSFIESMNATIEPQYEDKDGGDFIGVVATSYEQLSRAISNCQQSGAIRVEDFRICYLENTLEVSVNQYYDTTDSEGNVTDRRIMGNQKMQISRIDPASNMKTSILTRAKYEDIFSAEQFDEYDRVELIDVLNRTAIEKGKVIYLAQTRQEVFVVNQAHVTACPVSSNEITEDDKAEIAATLTEQGRYTPEEFEKECKAKTDRIHFSIVLSQPNAKAIANILSKLQSQNVYISRSDKFCSIFVDTDDERVGLWFEMPAAVKIHIGSVQRYSSMEYKNYQVSFMREFLSQMVKSAISATKDAKVELKFENKGEDQLTHRPIYELVVESGSASASTAETYRLLVDDSVDVDGDLDTKTFSISLKVFQDMLNQLKTVRVAFDINIGGDGVACIRLAEIDDVKNAEQYTEARKDLDSSTPTPLERKLEYRIKTLGVRQFTMLSK